MNVTCDKCGTSYEVPIFQNINVSECPEMKSKVISGELFVGTCPVCSRRKLISYPLVYRDSSQNLLICLSERHIEAEGCEGTARRVEDIGSLIEKVKIFDAALDDVVITMVKYVTVQELGKDVKLKFFKLDGPDNDLIFTYPEKGEMQMLSVGFNVYENCRAIVSRNPSMTVGIKGLALIDDDWLECFLK